MPPHISALRIPPAWREVRYDPNPDAALLATGVDAKGRRQAIYSASHSARQAAAKFGRIKALQGQLPAIVAENDRTAGSSDPRTCDSADALRLVIAMGIRPGSEDDTGAAERAYGASTLEGRHVVAELSGLRLQFVGKKGVRIDLPVPAELTGMLTSRAEAAGPNGKLFPNTSGKSLLAHVHSLGGGDFKTKDFRTLRGTTEAAGIIDTMNVPSSPAAYKRAVASVAKRVAAVLGNTPVVALQSYIDPSVFTAWRLVAHG